MKYLLILLMSTSLMACGGASGSDGTITISGKIEKAVPQGEVKLEKFEVGQIAPVKTVFSDHNGNFEMEVTLTEPGFYRINIYEKQFQLVVLNDADITITASGEPEGSIEVSGGQDMKNLEKLMDYMREYATRVGPMNQKLAQANQSSDKERFEELRMEAIAMESKKLKDLKSMAMGFESSLVSLLITDYIPNKSDEFNFLDSLSNKLQRELPGVTDVDYFVSNLDAYRPAVGMGDVAPELTLQDPDGKEYSLSDLRGKYVLLDFWAGWCRPCRMENPNVVRMYNKYNEDGFEVFSVSLDRTKKQWVDAIEKDGLTWPYHVSDLKYFQSEAAMIYKVNAIPYALLLDPEGKVIGKNLRGRMLQAKLESIFGE